EIDFSIVLSSACINRTLRDRDWLLFAIDGKSGDRLPIVEKDGHFIQVGIRPHLGLCSVVSATWPAHDKTLVVIPRLCRLFDRFVIASHCWKQNHLCVSFLSFVL